ncbi:MAG TPA: 1,4-dihydroxy-2-naphthoate polyprenyltransferase [Thermoanaerobaculia bacterium]|nr:1,4-dihydroxy-2-naphthoate polyprenyltransferase [Thermoanaerobaculia bacterium]
MNIKAWLLAARPKTLSASIAPVLVGTGLAFQVKHRVPWIYAVFALFSALFIQIATNLINDALDFRKGTDTSTRLGPVRVTQAGLLSAETVMRGAYVCLVVAALLGIPLILRGAWPIFVIGVASMIAAYAYTGGPYPLAYHGLGEVFVMIFFGIVAVGGTYYVLTLQYAIEAFLCGVAIGSLAVVILAINNLRDIEGDRASNKKTIAVRLGERGARAEIVAFIVLAFVAIAFVAPLTLLAMPLAIVLIVRVYRSSGRELNRCLAMAGALEMAFALLFLVICLFTGTR